MSLTKKILLAELACSKPEKLPEKFAGHDVWVKPVSEFQRSRRIAALTGKDGELDREAVKVARLYTIIDYVCDSEGEPLFKEKDLADLRKVDALKLDLLLAQVEEWVGQREGKLRGE